MDLQLSNQIGEYKVNEQTTKSIMSAYAPFVQEFNENREEAMSIIVTDINDVEGMQKAKEMRKKLSKIRTGLEAERKKIKEESLRTSNAIDGLANFIKLGIIEAEKHVETQEKFAIEKENERIREIMDTRINSLMPYLEEGKDPRTMFKLESLSDEDFNTLLDYTKEQWEKAETIRLQKEKEAEEEAEKERERLRKIEEDNKRLRKEAEEAKARELEKEKEKEAELAKAREEYHKKQQEEIKKHEAERAKKDAELKEQREKTRLLQEEKEQQERREREKKEADEKERKRIEKAGDVEKIRHWITQIRKIEVPKLNNELFEQWIRNNISILTNTIESKIDNSN